MKHILLIISALTCLITFAQGPTLTSASAPQPGDVFVTQPVNAASLVIGNGGANQTWDYSAAIDSGTSTTEWVSLVSSTPYAASFPGATLALVDTFSGDTAYAYELVNSSHLGFLGSYMSLTGGVYYTSPRIYYQYPLSYGNSYGTAFAGHSDNSDTITGTDSVIADGYGTLILPYRTFTNVLRLKTIEHSHSVNSGFGFFIDIDQTEYSYFIPGYHSELFSVQYSTVNTNGNIGSANTAHYSKAVTTGISDISATTSVSISPNPNHGLFTLYTADETMIGAAMSVTDLTGRVIIEGKLNSSRQIIDLGQQTQGLYILHIHTGSGSISKKLIIE